MERVGLREYRESMAAWHQDVVLGRPVMVCNDVRSVDAALLINFSTGQRLGLTPDRSGQSQFGVRELREMLTALVCELEEHRWQVVLVTTSGMPLLYLCSPDLAARLTPAPG